MRKRNYAEKVAPPLLEIPIESIELKSVSFKYDEKVVFNNISINLI